MLTVNIFLSADVNAALGGKLELVPSIIRLEENSIYFWIHIFVIYPSTPKSAKYQN